MQKLDELMSKGCLASELGKKCITVDLQMLSQIRDGFWELEKRAEAAEAKQDYFGSLVSKARISADKAMVKFPQPNYVLLKVAEEAGEVVQAGVHYAEGRMKWEQLEGEVVQLLAMLIRLVTEGDQVNGITPPAQVPLFTRPAPAADLAGLVPDEMNLEEAQENMNGHTTEFVSGIVRGFNTCRAAILRNIEEVK